MFDDVLNREEFQDVNEAILGIEDLGVDDALSTDLDEDDYFAEVSASEEVDEEFDDYPEDEIEDY